MTGANAALHDLSVWARGNLLVIVLLVLGAILLTRFAGWSRDRFMAHIDARADDDDELVRSEAAKHRQVVAQVVTWTALAVIYVVAAVLIIQNLGVPWPAWSRLPPCSAPRWGLACSGLSRTSGLACSSPGSGSTASAT